MPELTAQGPFLGVNKALNPSLLGPTEAADALNMYLALGSLQKRPGLTTRFSFPLVSILGIYDFLKIDTTTGAVTPIGMVKTANGTSGSLYKVEWTTDEPIATDMSLAMHGSEPCCFLTINNKVYFCDGLVFKVWDGAGTTTYNATAARPANAPTLGESGILPLTGTYDYKITWYAPDWGQETSSSDASATITVVNKTIELTGMPVPSGGIPDARFTKKRIYRRKVSAGETTWKYVDECAAASSTYSDIKKDNDVNDLIIAPLTYTSTLPLFRFMAWNEEVLFCSGAETEPTRIYFSRSGQPYNLDQYLEVGSGSDTDPITGLASFQGVLVVFKERSIWILTGNSVSTFNLKKIVPGVGCRSHHSIVPFANSLLFLSEDGFCAFDGANVSPVSGLETMDPIRPDIRNRNLARDRYCYGAYDPDYSVIVWTYSSAGSTTNDRMYAYFPELSKRVGQSVWCPWTMTSGVTAIGSMSDLTLERSLYFGRGDGIVGYLLGDADNGDLFNAYWVTGDFDGGIASKYKIWKLLDLEVVKQTEVSNLDLKYALDGATTATLLRTVDQSRSTYQSRLSRSSKDIRLEFRTSSYSPCDIMSWSLEFEQAGIA